MNDEQYFLANAYLDGELTAEVRGIAEADPEVMAEVEQLRALQSALRDTPAPSDEARESAISAAMAVFGTADPVDPTDLPDDERAPAPAPVVPFRPRPAYAKYLGIAAALVAVAGLGIVVSQAGQGDDDAADTMADTADMEESLERAGALTESFEADDGADAEMLPADDEGVAGADENEAADDAEMADEQPADDVAEPAAEATAEDTDDMAAAEDGDDGAVEGTYREVRAGFDPAAPITDDAELGVYGVYLIGERDSGQLPPTPNHDCVDAQEVLGTATLRLGDELIEVYVDVREADGMAVALRADTCFELMAGSLFTD